MDAKRWGQIKEIYDRALDLRGEEREGFLVEACGDDADLRREVESLLAAHANAGTFLQSPAVKVAAQAIVGEEFISTVAAKLLAAPQLIGQELANYRIVSLLGRGGMGEVYLAEDKRLHRKVALKLLPAKFTADADRVRRFEQEARSASALNHPNIIIIYEIGEADGAHYIATEYVPGQTLRQMMGGEGMSFGAALSVATQVANALAEAHKAGVLHRDIKPENLMVRPDGVVKVVDFGLAKLLDRRPEFANDAWGSTASGMVMGTARYMSPEQARGQEVDARTDIFSLGVVIYELIAGHAPFAGATMSDVIAALLKAEPLPLTHHSPEVPAELERIVSKALTKDREERYQTIKDLFLDLKRLKQRLEFEAELKRSRRLEVSGSMTTIISSRKEIVETVPKTGGISSRASGTALPLPKRRSRKAIGSLAVLPLVNASADANAEYLSDGITESIINSLSQVPKLRVMARSTVFRYKGREVDPQEVGRELNVRAILTGRVLQFSNSLVIGIELVDTTDGSQLWGEQYNRKPSDIFAVQEEIAMQVSEKLRIKLTGEEKRRLTKRYTNNTEAYQHYLKGRYFWSKRTGEAVKKSLEYFDQAIEKDSNYALAHAGLADSYNMLGSYGVLPMKESYLRAEEAATEALKIDDNLAEAHTSLAAIAANYWDWPRAERQFKRAIKLNPNYATAHQWYSEYLSLMGRFDEAIAEMKRAQTLDPLSLVTQTVLGMLFYRSRQNDQAIEQLLKTLDMDPNFFLAYFYLGLAYVQKGMYEEAISEIQKGRALSGGATDLLAILGYAYAVGGKRGEAQRALNKLTQLSKRQYVSPISIAEIYIGLGGKEQAFEWLEKAYDNRTWSVGLLKVDPIFDPLRSDPRFRDLLLRVGLV